MSIVSKLGEVWLRHYKDPSSWAGIIAAVALAAHWKLPPEWADPIAQVCAAAVTMLLLWIDGRKNPNTGSDGAITVRPPAPPVGTASVVTPSMADIVIVPGLAGADSPQPERPGFTHLQKGDV